MYIRGADNTVADIIIRLDRNLSQNRHADDKDSIECISEERWNAFLALFKHYVVKSSDESNGNCKYDCSQIFANIVSDDKSYPLTIAEIADVRRRDPLWKHFCMETDPKRECCNVIIDETEV